MRRHDIHPITARAREKLTPILFRCRCHLYHRLWLTLLVISQNRQFTPPLPLRGFLTFCSSSQNMGLEWKLVFPILGGTLGHMALSQPGFPLPLSNPLHTFRRSSQGGDRLAKISSGGGVRLNIENRRWRRRFTKFWQIFEKKWPKNCRMQSGEFLAEIQIFPIFIMKFKFNVYRCPYIRVFGNFTK